MVENLISASTINKSKVEYLVQAETDSELETQMEQVFKWTDDDSISWEPIGGVVNTDVFGNLTDSMTALVENFTNSSDAYLLQNYDGGDYQNCFEAADSVLDSEDHRVKMRVDGDKPSSSSDGYSITFSDAAHGQPKENFDVFVNPLESGLSKQEYDFLQGCRGVGSITALGHTESGYKFIASAPDEDPENWTWTIIKSGKDNGYYYLTINDEMPTFEGEFDCGAGIGRKSQGTVVKLYNYELPTNPKDAAHGNVFRRELSRYIPEPVVPIELYDTRYSDEPSLFRGVGDEFAENDEIFHTETIEKDVFGIGPVEAEVYVGLPEDDREDAHEEGEIDSDLVSSLSRYFASNTNKRGLVCVNGQTHHAYTTSELKSLANIDYCGKNTLVVLHLLDNKSTVGESLFNSGRTGFSDTSAKDQIEKSVFPKIGESEKIQEINSEYEEVSKANQTASVQDMVSITENEDGTKEVTLNMDEEDEGDVVISGNVNTNTTVDLSENDSEETEESTTLEIDESAIVSSVADDMTLTKNNLSAFLDECFKTMVSKYEGASDRNITDFQSVASSVGSVFEAYFEYVVETLHEDIEVERDVVLEDAMMVGTGSADAVLYDESGEIIAIIELKGNPKVYKNAEGEVLHKASCSGLERSDTVKKAVCQSYQATKGYPDTPFFLVSNTLPTEDSSPEKVLEMAQGELIDEVVNATDKNDIQSMFEEVEAML